MSSKCLVLLLLVLLFKTGVLFAQSDTNRIRKHAIELQLYTTVGFVDRQHESLENKYNINRTLLIYKYNIVKQLRLSVAGNTYLKDKNKPLELTPYLKRAYLQYHDKKISITAGLIVLEQFKYQRKIWQLRYIDKTFQNKFKYGENRNVGLKMKHELSNSFAYDFALTSGYSTPIDNYTEEYAFSGGQTFKLPFCTFRLFNSFMIKQNIEHTSSLFIAKKLNKTNIGVEFAGQFNCSEDLFEQQKGGSIFVNHRFFKKVMYFARYDLNQSYLQEDYLLTGIEYSLKEHTKISLYANTQDFTTYFYGFSVFYNYFESSNR
jgi:hypothetical protein